MKLKRLISVIAVFSLLGVVFIYVLSTLWKTRAENLFREYVRNPIPESVAQIKVDKPISRGGYGYVFRFNIEREDFESILKSHSLRKAVITVDVEGTGLNWEWEDWDYTKSDEDHHVMGFSIYALVRKPSWYDLPTWENPEAYAFMKEGNNEADIKVLIYNNKLGQAYFITIYGHGL